MQEALKGALALFVVQSLSLLWQAKQMEMERQTAGTPATSVPQVALFVVAVAAIVGVGPAPLAELW